MFIRCQFSSNGTNYDGHKPICYYAIHSLQKCQVRHKMHGSIENYLVPHKNGLPYVASPLMVTGHIRGAHMILADRTAPAPAPVVRTLKATYDVQFRLAELFGTGRLTCICKASTIAIAPVISNGFIQMTTREGYKRYRKQSSVFQLRNDMGMIWRQVVTWTKVGWLIMGPSGPNQRNNWVRVFALASRKTFACVRAFKC